MPIFVLFCSEDRGGKAGTVQNPKIGGRGRDISCIEATLQFTLSGKCEFLGCHIIQGVRQGDNKHSIQFLRVFAERQCKPDLSKKLKIIFYIRGKLSVIQGYLLYKVLYLFFVCSKGSRWTNMVLLYSEAS